MQQAAAELLIQDALPQKVPGGESAIDRLNGRDFGEFILKAVCRIGGTAASATFDERAKRGKRKEVEVAAVHVW